MRVTDKHVFFWGEFPSNWYPCYFTIEQEGKKLEFFNSEANEILEKGKNPKTAKALGRKVKNYDDKVWDENRYQVMVYANMLKYSQNQELKEQLLNKEFDGKHFVEASPYDHVWGVGLGENNPLVDNEDNWLGQNLLGKALDEVRNKL